MLTRAALMRAMLTAEDCARARQLEWRRKRANTMHPGMTAEARKKARKQAEGNASIPARVALWTSLETLLKSDNAVTGRVELSTRGSGEGSGRVVSVHRRKEIQAHVTSLPMLLLDAIMQVAIVRHYLPRLEVLAEIRVQAPHQRLHQIIGGWGKTSLSPHGKATVSENNRRIGRLAELRDFVALNGGQNPLVVTYEDIEDRFRRLPGVETAHFNAIAGLDVHRDVRTLFVIGRPLPSPEDVRMLALELTGKPLALAASQTEMRGARGPDGRGIGIKVRVYADPDFEMVRAAITDAEVAQAIGRARGVNRTADNPVDVFLFADVVLTLTVAGVARWAEVCPDPIARMWARGSVLLSATDAAAAWPDLFPTPEAARKALHRGEAKGHFPDISLRYITAVRSKSE